MWSCLALRGWRKTHTILKIFLFVLLASHTPALSYNSHTCSCTFYRKKPIDSNCIKAQTRKKSKCLPKSHFLRCGTHVLQETFCKRITLGCYMDGDTKEWRSLWGQFFHLRLQAFRLRFRKKLQSYIERFGNPGSSIKTGRGRVGLNPRLFAAEQKYCNLCDKVRGNFITLYKSLTRGCSLVGVGLCSQGTRERTKCLKMRQVVFFAGH